jgi:hypothetical protein
VSFEFKKSSQEIKNIKDKKKKKKRQLTKEVKLEKKK